MFGGGKRVRGHAVVAAIRQTPVDHYDRGESSSIDDLTSALWGRTSHHLALDVHLPGHGPYRVEGEWKVPNRMGRIRHLWRDRSVRIGMTLPVLVNPANPGEVEVDWKSFVDSGQVQAGEKGIVASITGGVRDLVNDIKGIGDPGGGELVPPDAIRPHDTTHPPIAGVGFDRWIAANVAAMVDKVPRDGLHAHFVAHGFPAGAVDEVNVGWYERAKADGGVGAWYVYEITKGRR